MQGSLNTGTIICIKRAYALVHVIDLNAGHLVIAQGDFAFHKTGGWHTPEVQNDLEEIIAVVDLLYCVADVVREHVQQGIKIVCDVSLRHTCISGSGPGPFGLSSHGLLYLRTACCREKAHSFVLIRPIRDG